jgi:two-component system repressor protein LuxO
MPPLRARRSDIIDLADHFLRLYAKEEGKSFRSFAQDAENILLSCSWPGNVRQLQNVVRGIVVLHEGKFVTAPMLPSSLRDAGSDSMVLPSTIPPVPVRDDGSDVSPLWKVERSAIEHAIALCEGNIPKAAALLEISPSTIYRKKMMWDKHAPPTGNGQGAFYY